MEMYAISEYNWAHIQSWVSKDLITSTTLEVEGHSCWDSDIAVPYIYLEVMASANGSKANPYLSSSYLHGIYIPYTLLVVGTAIVKWNWVPYAVVVGAILGAWKSYSNRKWCQLYMKSESIWKNRPC